jgi:hypothetical protein
MGPSLPIPASGTGETVDRDGARAYLEAVAAHGVRRLLENGEGLEISLRRLGERLVPVVVSDGRPGKAATASPTAHYLVYPLHELGRHRGRLVRLGLRLAQRLPESLLRAAELDRVVLVNHWLFPSALPLPADRTALAAFVAAIRAEWPEHAVVLPGVVPVLSPELAAALHDIGGRAVPSRVVHLQRPGRPLRGGAMRSVRHNRNADFAVLERYAARTTTDAVLLARQADRIADLYRQLYLERHPARLNPQFTAEFFRLLLESGAFEARGWTGENGRLIAFNVRLVHDGVIWWTIGGYDTTLPRSHGLYRLIAIDDVAAVEDRGLVLNQGGGNGDFKRRRGAEPAIELDVVFDRHLPRRRRLPWQALAVARRWRLAQPGSWRSTQGGGP